MTQTVPDISPLMPMHQDPLLVAPFNSSPPGAASMNRVSVGTDNGLALNRRQAIIYTNAWLFSIGPLERNFSEILIKISKFPFTQMHLKISSAKWRPFSPGRDELRADSISIKASYRKILQSREICVGIVRSLWNFTGVWAALLWIIEGRI